MPALELVERKDCGEARRMTTPDGRLPKAARSGYTVAMSDGDPLRAAAPPFQVGEPLRQLLTFGGAGIAAVIVHYSALIGLVQTGTLDAVPAALCGYVAGGGVSYALNRRHTYRSDRPHQEAAWRFAVVATVGFLITWAVMHVLVDRWSLPYLLAQVLTTGLVMMWSFSAHKWWTFRERKKS
jgi:putative flippase GtrA